MIEVLHFLLVSLCHLFNRTEPWRDSWLQGLFDFAVWGNGNTVQQGDLQNKKRYCFLSEVLRNRHCNGFDIFSFLFVAHLKRQLSPRPVSFKSPVIL